MEYYNPQDYKNANTEKSFDVLSEFPVKLERLVRGHNGENFLSSITIGVVALNETAAAFAALEEMPGWTIA